MLTNERRNGETVKPNAVNINTVGDRTLVTTPYNPAFNSRAKLLGGRWNRESWVFNAETEPKVREAVISIFGTDQKEYQSVTVRIDAHDAWMKDSIGGDSALYFAGRKILGRGQRDAEIRLGEDVALISGTLPRTGGSTRYPSLALERAAGVTLEIYAVPAGHPDLDDEYVKIVSLPVTRESLTLERDNVQRQLDAITESLTRRIAELDKQLADL